MREFLLILRDDPANFADFSPTQVQALVERYSAWRQQIIDAGHYSGGNKLMDNGGHHLRHRDGRLLISDGPYTEAKDVIGGYFLIKAESLEHAQEICADCPHLDYGWIELRETDPMAACAE